MSIVTRVDIECDYSNGRHCRKDFNGDPNQSEQRARANAVAAGWFIGPEDYCVDHKDERKTCWHHGSKHPDGLGFWCQRAFGHEGKHGWGDKPNGVFEREWTDEEPEPLIVHHMWQ
jgi:hypothetical protein